MSAAGISVLLAVDAGLLRNALQNMLSTMLQVRVLTITSDIPATKQAIAINQPLVVIIDIDLLGDQLSSIEEISRIIAPNGLCLVLANDKEQKVRVEKLGAKNAVLKGTHSKRLEQIIVGFQPPHGAEKKDFLPAEGSGS
jgi:DNA-binding NarL/FixJ family response regulator